MIKFGSDNVIVGYIKQLLSTFNLPMIDIYKEGKQLVENFQYIKNNKIYLAKEIEKTENGKIIKTIELLEDKSTPYIYNKFIPNITTTFNNSSITYDAETHKYLGKYLRFNKEYNHLNLMSLYNCFSNDYILNFKFDGTDLNTEDTEIYKYFKVPIVGDADYTIAIECQQPYEFCCIFYDKQVISSPLSDELRKNTYQKLNSSSFNKPYLFTKMHEFYNNIKSNKTTHTTYSNLKDSLYLIIKLPISCKSSIVMLEGNYTTANDFTLVGNKLTSNHSITNYKVDRADDLINIPLISRSQLLSLNDGNQYAFSDKLIGYLLDNTITNMTTISEDITRIQDKLSEIKENQSDDNLLITAKNISYPQGIWKDNFRNIMYDYYRKSNNNINTKTYDILGYCDKDIEKALSLLKLRKGGK